MTDLTDTEKSSGERSSAVQRRSRFGGQNRGCVSNLSHPHREVITPATVG